MLKKERQNKYLFKRWKILLISLQAFSATKNPEELHQMRVEIKKIQAFFTFLKTCSRKNLLKPLKPVKKIFKHAGLIRSAHVNLQLIEQYHLSNKEFEKEQNEIFNSQSNQFCLRTNHYVKKIGQVRRIYFKNFKNIKNKRILAVFEADLQELSRSFAKLIDTSKLHPLRKKLKMLMYMLELLPKSLLNKLQVNKTYVHQLQDLIGNWHDTIEASDLIAARYQDTELINKLQLKSRRMLQKINHISANFENKAFSFQSNEVSVFFAGKMT